MTLMSVTVLQKVQRNGLAVDLEEELKPAETQTQSESPDPAGGRSDKVYSRGRKKQPFKPTNLRRDRVQPQSVRFHNDIIVFCCKS